MKEHMAKVLAETFDPSYLKIVDDSHKHAHHREGSDKGNTHFAVTINAKAFHNKSQVFCHRQVYKALDIFIKRGVHALQINTNA